VTLHKDLLEQARYLARRDKKRPKQANLRRAVSAAYYALFHLLVEDGAKAIRPSAVRDQVRRLYEHGSMKAVCKAWAQGAAANLPASTGALVTAPIERELSDVASAFVRLQNARHAADYDLARTFNRLYSVSLLGAAEQAFRDWNAIRATPNAAVFLASLLFEKQWKGR